MTRVVRDGAVRASAAAGVVVAAGAIATVGRWPVAVAVVVVVWAALTVAAVAVAARR
ncbi:MAG: hypothetical protein FWD11_04170 [Micrococcales bacterium]|nr:hypothetical protein [Micrococcales bacterium]